MIEEYAIQKYLGKEELKQVQCTKTCVISVEAVDVVKDCLLTCPGSIDEEATSVTIEYQFSLKRNYSVTVTIVITSDDEELANVSYDHSTPWWCTTDWCDIAESQTITLSRAVVEGESLDVSFVVEKA